MGNNEVKCTIIKIQNVNAVDGYKRTVNCKWPYTANIFMFKVNNRNTRKKSEICSKFTIETPERRH